MNVADESPARSSRTKFVVLASLFFAWVVCYADRIAIAIAIIPVSKEFQLTAAQSGYLFSAFYVSYSVMQLVGGSLADRFGGRRVLIGCVLLWSVFTSLTGFAWSFGSLLLMRALFGAGEGCFSPATSATVAENFVRSERGRAKGFLLSTDFIGSAIGSGAIALAISAYGWHRAYQYFGLVGLVAAVVLYFGLPGREREKGGAIPAVKLGAPRLSELIRNPCALNITAIWFCIRMLWIGVVSWMPSYLLKTRGISLEHLGVATVIPYCLAFFGANAVGWALDKFMRGREKVLMAAGSLLSAFFLYCTISSSELTTLVAFWTACMLSFNLTYVTLFSIPLKYFPDAAAGRVTGVMNFGGQLAGIIAPAAIGQVITVSHGRYETAFLFLTLCGVFAFMFAIFWRPYGSRSTDHMFDVTMRRSDAS